MQPENKQMAEETRDEMLELDIKELDIKKETGTGPVMADMQASAMSVVALTVYT